MEREGKQRAGDAHCECLGLRDTAGDYEREWVVRNYPGEQSIKHAPENGVKSHGRTFCRSADASTLSTCVELFDRCMPPDRVQSPSIQ